MGIALEDVADQYSGLMEEQRIQAARTRDGLLEKELYELLGPLESKPAETTEEIAAAARRDQEFKKERDRFRHADGPMQAALKRAGIVK